ncbi:hemin ABC transporter ATP-binding protein [Oceanobacillus iheyensis]|uniref:Putative hemin import ATP-binding protein HrtA n=1 Tax=Oceanobacillus jordanicus TaxID=2867266 RepID=A0AAW5B641_9BACI|nr:ABC transporter ATP-binding protein [Oceanobacillus jordanicus]AVQ98218.1 hemin ABC transporter ATP-binding protein [Oceanobacillus iheyensis]MCG3419871.1 ABC transporter ATP-binding protein [Oceanobacillus jordanicus]NAP00499.1 ATP-binding cassette domain-containing protein [Halomonas sp. MG34]
METLSINKLVKTFKDGNKEETILKGIDLELSQGEITALIGASGSGKSTLLTVVAGLQKSTKGKIIFEDRELTEMNPTQLRAVRAKRFGFVFQHAHLVQFLTVQEQLQLMVDTAELNWSKKKREEEIKSVLQAVDMWSHKDSYPDNLSGGEKQRVAIARAIIHQPSMLFADEPTASLDSKRSIEVIELLRSLSKERNHTVLMVTHDTDMLKYADRTVIMKDGVISES